MFLWFLVVVVVASGSGLKITSSDLAPYKEKFRMIYGHYPKKLEEKKEVLYNCLMDRLLLKRARELKVEEDRDFKSLWMEVSTEVKDRCRREKMGDVVCYRILKRYRDVLKILFVMRKEVLPEIDAASGREYQSLLLYHDPFKEKYDRMFSGYAGDVGKVRALKAYMDRLMKRYKVKIDYKALEDAL